MWKKTALLPDDELAPSLDPDADSDGDFLAMLDTAGPGMNNEAHAIFSLRLLLPDPLDSSDQPEQQPDHAAVFCLQVGQLRGELVVFKDHAADTDKICALLQSGLESWLRACDGFSEPLVCQRLEEKAGAPVFLLTSQKFVEQDCANLEELCEELLAKASPLGTFKGLSSEFTEDNLDEQPNKLDPNKLQLLRCVAMLTLLSGPVSEVEESLPFQAVSLTKFVSDDQELRENLLQHVNAFFAGTSVKAESVDHAMLLLGQGRFLRWLAAKALLRLGRLCSCSALALQTLHRAALLSFLAPQEDAGEDIQLTSAWPQQHFFLALRPALTSILKTSLEKIAESLKFVSIEDIGFAPVPGALLYTPEDDNTCLELLEALENADWPALDIALNKLNIDEKRLKVALYEAARWESLL